MTNILSVVTIDIKANSPFQAKCDLILNLQKAAYALAVGDLVSGKDGDVTWTVHVQEGKLL